MRVRVRDQHFSRYLVLFGYKTYANNQFAAAAAAAHTTLLTWRHHFQIALAEI